MEKYNKNEIRTLVEEELKKSSFLTNDIVNKGVMKICNRNIHWKVRILQNGIFWAESFFAEREVKEVEGRSYESAQEAIIRSICDLFFISNPKQPIQINYDDLSTHTSLSDLLYGYAGKTWNEKPAYKHEFVNQTGKFRAMMQLRSKIFISEATSKKKANEINAEKALKMFVPNLLETFKSILQKKDDNKVDERELFTEKEILEAGDVPIEFYIKNKKDIPEDFKSTIIKKDIKEFPEAFFESISKKRKEVLLGPSHFNDENSIPDKVEFPKTLEEYKRIKIDDASGVLAQETSQFGHKSPYKFFNQLGLKGEFMVKTSCINDRLVHVVSFSVIEETFLCSNMSYVNHLASQLILKKIHPQCKTWYEVLNVTDKK